MKDFKWYTLFLIILCLILVMVSCGRPDTSKTSGAKKLTVGFSQVGAESVWRITNTVSIKKAAEEAGINLIFKDAQQKQENQITAIRSFIAQKVDFIAFSPVVDNGWDVVLKEAKDAGIPVILVDRKANVEQSLYVTLIGSDFYEEGVNACKEMAKLLNETGNIVEIQGNIGSDPAIKRKKGFQDQLVNYPKMKIVKSETGDFFRQRGKEVMATFLKDDAKKIDAAYIHNDDMALGAIEAINEYGLNPGKDIKIVSVDAVSQDIFNAILEGKSNVTVECSPNLGPQLFETIKKIAAGETVEKWIKTNEGIFDMENAKQKLELIKK